MNTGRQEATLVVSLALVAVVLTSLFGAVEYEQATSSQGKVASLSRSVSELETENQNLSSIVQVVASENPAAAVPAMLAHLSNFDNRNVNASLAGYTQNATVIWKGDTMGIGGTYVGSQDIRFTLETFLGSSTVLNFSVSSVGESFESNGTSVTSALAFSGNSRVFGEFNGTIIADDYYVSVDGSWLISREVWNFTSYNVETQPEQAGF